MAPAPLVGEAFFPLDEELGLVSGGLTPRGEETLVRLASWMPFEQAREMLQDLVGMRVGAPCDTGDRGGSAFGE